MEEQDLALERLGFRALGHDCRPAFLAGLPRRAGACVYADAWLYVTQACRGVGRGLGMWYREGDFQVALGRHNGHFALVRPHGRPRRRLAEIVTELHAASGKPVFVKKAAASTAPLHGVLPSERFERLSADLHPWAPDAPSDDDTFAEAVVDLRSIHALCGRYGRVIRSKTKRAQTAVDEIVLQTNGATDWSDVDTMIGRHFGGEDEKQRAYRNLIDVLARRRPADGTGYFVASRSGEVCALFAYERIDARSAGLYASIAERSVTGLSEALHMALFRRLRELGFERLNLGGAESRSLAQHKRKYVEATGGYLRPPSPITAFRPRR